GACAVGVERRAYPIAMREIAESAIGQPLVGIHVVTGELVDLVAARLETPAFTIGSEVFVAGDVMRGGGRAVLVHEAIHAAQQSGAATTTKIAREPGAESDAHRILRRLGPLSTAPTDAMARERARAAATVRAALGRTPHLPRRQASLAAFEPTDETHEVGRAIVEGRKLAAALRALLE